MPKFFTYVAISIIHIAAVTLAIHIFPELAITIQAIGILIGLILGNLLHISFQAWRSAERRN